MPWVLIRTCTGKTFSRQIYFIYQRWWLLQPNNTKPLIVYWYLYYIAYIPVVSLQWCHSERDGVSNHHLHCLLNCLFRCWSKKTSKLRVTCLCEGNSTVTGEFPAQRASNVENVSIWWHHHYHHDEITCIACQQPCVIISSLVAYSIDVFLRCYSGRRRSVSVYYKANFVYKHCAFIIKTS